jgi:hypothetical protein
MMKLGFDNEGKRARVGGKPSNARYLPNRLELRTGRRFPSYFLP